MKAVYNTRFIVCFHRCTLQGIRLSASHPDPTRRKQGLSHWLHALIASDSQLGLAVMALLAGLLAALVITVFRLLIEIPLELVFPMTSEDDYEALSAVVRLLLLGGGGLCLILLFQWLKPEQRSVGLTHVLIRMERNQGYLPKSNLLVQWIAAGIALLSGHSVGREGPAIHMGAGAASQLGQYADIAHHRLRILAGAGVASAISASFNTPMAGVIFAMEVVLLEYSIRGFIPIILASVAGAIFSQLTFGTHTAFDVPSLGLYSLLEIPYVILLGVIGGITAGCLIWLVRYLQRLNTLPLSIKWGGLTLTTGLISIGLPEILGIGYDTVNAAIDGQVIVPIFLALLFAKLLLTAWAAATGFPAGLIGPSLFMGAMIGGLLGELSAVWMPDYPAATGFYVLLGMATMMGAVLGAPLAALVALLELTGNPNIIMPGMLSIVIGTLVVSEGFKLPSVVDIQLKGNGQYVAPDPVRLLLRNTWVKEVMDTAFISTDRYIRPESAQWMLDSQSLHPSWFLLEKELMLVPPAALAAELSQSAECSPQDPVEDSLIGDGCSLDLLDMPADRESIGVISLKANLQDALDQMEAHDLQWLAVVETAPHDTMPTSLQRGECIGLVSRTMIDRYYRYKPG